MIIQVPECSLPGLVPVLGNQQVVRNANRLPQRTVSGGGCVLVGAACLLAQCGVSGAGTHLHCLPGRHVPVLRPTQCRGGERGEWSGLGTSGVTGNGDDR